jgi:hypothetical protein
MLLWSNPVGGERRGVNGTDVKDDDISRSACMNTVHCARPAVYSELKVPKEYLTFRTYLLIPYHFY